jgi:hypothetical protein
MKLLDFGNRFKDEQTCRDHFRDLRLKYGIRCKRCEVKTKHYWLSSVNKFQCSLCRSRTNLKAGTMLQKSKMTFLAWFKIVHFMTTIKKPFSALAMKDQLGSNRYEPIWFMMHKVRRSMGKRDSWYLLQGEIEMDEAFFESVFDKEVPIIDDHNEPFKLKRGRGSQRQEPVLIMVESRSAEIEIPHKKSRVMGFAKISVLDFTDSKSINFSVLRRVDRGTIINTDGWGGYNKLSSILMIHRPQVVKPEDAMKKLPWVHTIIANAKRQLLGIHHSINGDYLQNYLDEFVYKLNRRNFKFRDMFDRMMEAAVSATWL